jgi:chemotaxis protein CheY-P-specific phosphatase CheC/CheY-like chemotaxis protein
MSPGKVLSETEARTVKRLLASTANAVAETLGSLVDRQVVAKPKGLETGDAEAVLGKLDGNYAVVRGALDKDFAGRTFRVLFAAQDATTLAATMMMTPEEVIAERRKAGTLEGEDLEAFGEVGNILCSGIDTVLRQKIGANVGLRLQDHGVIQPGVDDDELLGDGSDTFLLLEFEMRIAELPPRSGYLVVDVATAEAWNGKPFLVDPAREEEDHPKPTEASRKRAIEVGQSTFEEIPAAPIRGDLTCYPTTSKVYDVIRRSCRRVGLHCERGGRGDVPNPSALHGQVVVIDVPVGEERRFDWCKRLKAYDQSICVVLLVHMPSRSRVLQGFMARADAILAWPLTEPELSDRLGSLLEAVEAAPASAADKDAPDQEG